MRFHDIAELNAQKRVREESTTSEAPPYACNRDARVACEVMILQGVREKRTIVGGERH
jgi:hypothetical protein